MRRSSMAIVLVLAAAVAGACGSDTKSAVRTDVTSAKPGQIQGEPTPVCGTGDDTRPAPVGIAKLDPAVNGGGESSFRPGGERTDRCVAHHDAKVRRPDDNERTAPRRFDVR